MNKKVNKFLEDVCSPVRCRDVHDEIKEELMLHIDESAGELIAGGEDEDTAYEKAVSYMGNPSEIGERLDKKHRPQTEWSLILLTAFISLFGILIVYLSLSSEIYRILPGRYVVYTAIGITTLLCLFFHNCMKLGEKTEMLFGLGMFILILCFVGGIRYNGVRSYLNLGFMSIGVNPVSILIFSLAFSGFTVKYTDEGFMGILKLWCWGAVSLLMYVIQPSVSSFMILGIVYVVLTLAAIYKGQFGGNRRLQAVITVAASFGASVIAFLTVLIKSPRNIERLMFVFDKGASDPYGGGWIYAIAHKVLNGAKFIGKGEVLPQGNVDMLLPGITTDYALINIIHNYGWLAGILLIAAIGIYIIRLFAVTSKVKNCFGFYISLGAATCLAMQFLINILYNLGFFPVVDVSLPFVSYGGTGYAISMACVGIVLSVWRRNNILPAKKEGGKTKRRMIIFETDRIIINIKTNNH